MFVTHLMSPPADDISDPPPAPRYRPPPSFPCAYDHSAAAFSAGPFSPVSPTRQPPGMLVRWVDVMVGQQAEDRRESSVSSSVVLSFKA